MVQRRYWVGVLLAVASSPAHIQISGCVDSIAVADEVISVRTTPLASDEDVQEQRARDAAWLTRHALTVGLNGSADTRRAALEKALATDADCEEAHWHLGEVRYKNEWLPVDEVESRVATDPDIAEYRKLKAALNGDSQRTLALATWCMKRGMPDAAELHLRQVLASRESRAADQQDAARRLGLERVGDRWLSSAEAKALRDRSEQTDKLERRLASSLRRWRRLIEGNSAEQRQQAIDQIRELKDSNAITILERGLSASSVPAAAAMTEVLSTWDHKDASLSLARHALLVPDETVQQAATAELKRRSIHDFVPELLSMLAPRLTTEFRVANQSDGVIRHEHMIKAVGQDRDQILAVKRTHVPIGVSTPSTDDARTGFENTVANFAERQTTEALSTIREAASIEQQVWRQNLTNEARNERIYAVLGATTGTDLPAEPEAWWTWWREYNDQYEVDRPTEVRYASTTSRYSFDVPGGGRRHECFVAGTLVRTQAGLRPIEQIAVGDRVLAQDVETGELAYKLVRGTTVRPPTAMRQISIGSESFISTMGHLYWVEDKGWRMARNLEVGDRLHTVAGMLSIEALEDAGDATAYNLIVDDFDTYFVGKHSVL
ncbi:MAG: Hint domain-containing protein, partial [Planctomycetales bacterium]|nr:Hint domain-containing protein [Planctomycetales bacterium]